MTTKVQTIHLLATPMEGFKLIIATITLGIVGLSYAANTEPVKVPKVITQAAIKYCKPADLPWDEAEARQIYLWVKADPEYGHLTDNQMAEVISQYCRGIVPDVSKYKR